MKKMLKGKAVLYAGVSAAAVLLIVYLIFVSRGFKYKFFFLGDNYSPEGDLVHGGGDITLDSWYDINIYWYGGSVSIEKYDGNTIRVLEKGDFSEKNQLCYAINEKKTRLSIYYKAPTFLSIAPAEKELTVLIPANKVSYCTVNTTTADIILSGFLVGRPMLHTNSGDIIFKNVNCFSETELSTIKGDISFTGNCRSPKLSAVSEQGCISIEGAFTECDIKCGGESAELRCTSVPEKLSLVCENGDAGLLLPEDARFSVAIYSKDGGFENEFGLKQRGGSFTNEEEYSPAPFLVSAEKGKVSVRKLTPDN